MRTIWNRRWWILTTTLAVLTALDLNLVLHLPGSLLEFHPTRGTLYVTS
jgi:hypothetical protein